MVAPASFPEKGEKTDAEEKNAAADALDFARVEVERHAEEEFRPSRPDCL